MEKWVHEKLTEVLNSSMVEELSRYIVQIDNETDLEEFLLSLLDSKNLKHMQFIADVKKQRVFYSNQIGYNKINYPDNNKVMHKKNDSDIVCSKSIINKEEETKEKENIQIPTMSETKNKNIEIVNQKKTKFVKIYSREGDILLQGRHKCQCEGKNHAIVNNCITCGRIVCKQEGSGPCFFCRELVCSKKEQKILQNNSRQSNTLYNKLMERKPTADYEDSLKQRDKLLEYDRNSARRTKVIDDQSDYYQSNSGWLSVIDREKIQRQEQEMQKRKHTSQLDQKFTLDFMGRKVIVEDQFSDEASNASSTELDDTLLNVESERSIVCPMIDFDHPTLVELGKSETRKRVKKQTWNIKSKVQDKDYLEISDQGLCLSMNQPYASLLVAGVKIHEGRRWYSPHRGRLWISSTSKVASEKDISSMEHTYHVLKNEKHFPETYPSSCLLGCVTVTDVLPQEEYRKLYPEGECTSPYVFICEGSYRLPVPFPIQGKSKIYKMDKKVHYAAMRCLEKVIKLDN